MWNWIRWTWLLPLIALILITPYSLAKKANRAPNLCAVSYPSDSLIKWECRRIGPKETLEGLFGPDWVDIARFNRIDRRHIYPGVSIKVPERLEDAAGFTPMPPIHPPAEREEKFIMIDLTEQFLGAYEYGRLIFSTPIASGEEGNETPTGEFRITGYHKSHSSSLYFIEDTKIPYPMDYALRFYINEKGVAFWIHGRDLPGYPVSHGCIGLYYEPMQEKYHKYPKEPVLEDARVLYQWVLGPVEDDGKFHPLKKGPRLLIIGKAPTPSDQSPQPPRRAG